MRLSLFNNEDEPEVSMSPLIDCVFLLLIFFLVSTMTKVKKQGYFSGSADFGISYKTETG